jgi:copper resistance protein B
MKKIVYLLLLLVSANGFAMGEDDPLLYMFKLDKFEARTADHGTPVEAVGDAWIGKDLNKLWFKTEAEYVDSAFEELEAQLLYSRAISAFWDVQVGWRRDIRPTPEKDWFALSLNGLAPYMFETDLSLFVDDGGLINLRLDTELEFMLTQRLILSPELEANIYSEATEAKKAGLTDLTTGLRLYYEIIREFAPYIGISKAFSYNDKQSQTHSEEDLQFVAGVKVWF